MRGPEATRQPHENRTPDRIRVAVSEFGERTIHTLRPKSPTAMAMAVNKATMLNGLLRALASLLQKSRLGLHLQRLRAGNRIQTTRDQDLADDYDGNERLLFVMASRSAGFPKRSVEPGSILMHAIDDEGRVAVLSLVFLHICFGPEE